MSSEAPWWRQTLFRAAHSKTAAAAGASVPTPASLPPPVPFVRVLFAPACDTAQDAANPKRKKNVTPSFSSSKCVCVCVGE